MSAVRDVQIVFHTALVVLHGLGAYWHFRRRHRWSGALHTVGWCIAGRALVDELLTAPEPGLTRLREAGL